MLSLIALAATIPALAGIVLAAKMIDDIRSAPPTLDIPDGAARIVAYDKRGKYLGSIKL